MDPSSRIMRLKFRAWHRGTREADYMIGGFFDRYHDNWADEEVALFEALLDEEDHDVMAWALGTQSVPPEYDGPMMAALQKLDYVEIK